jgi:hypothetical protein
MGEQKNSYRDFVGIPESKGPHGRHRRRWEKNIEMYLKELGSSNSGQEHVTV